MPGLSNGSRFGVFRDGAVVHRRERLVLLRQCSACDVVFVANTREDRAHRALAAGARLEMWTLPAELTERPPAGRAIDAVDILELRLALMEPEWFDKLRDMTFPEDRKA